MEDLTSFYTSTKIHHASLPLETKYDLLFLLSVIRNGPLTKLSPFRVVCSTHKPRLSQDTPTALLRAHDIRSLSAYSIAFRDKMSTPYQPSRPLHMALACVLPPELQSPSGLAHASRVFHHELAWLTGSNKRKWNQTKPNLSSLDWEVIDMDDVCVTTIIQLASRQKRGS